MDGLTIGLIFLLVLVLGAGIVFLILWLVERNKGKSKQEQEAQQKAELDIKDVDFVLLSNTEVQASWLSVGSVDDEVILYASLDKINLDSSGVPENSSGVLKSSIVKGSSGAVNLSGLSPNKKYNLILVVTNTKFAGFNPTPETIFTASPPTGEFTIQELEKSGGIELQTNNSVEYVEAVNKTNLRDVWEYDLGQDTNATPTFSIFSQQNSRVLYNDNGKLSSGVLRNLNSNLFQWVYNNNGKQQWCLLNNRSVCMELDADGKTINVKDNSDTKWKNVPIK